MNTLFKNRDDELFSELLIKEHELNYWKKIYSKKISIENKNYTLKLLKLINYYIYSIKALSFVKGNKSELDIEVPEKIIKHNKYSFFNFKIHFVIKRCLNNVSFDYRESSFLQIKYCVYAIIEYIPDGMLTYNKYFFKSFRKYKNANIYLNILINRVKKKNIRFIIEKLLKQNEKQCFSLRRKLKII